MNLRAALYRCLNELKKNGVLGKDTVLRKTMLDECQGEKFWEICLGFSAVVVRRCGLEKRRKYCRPVAERLGTVKGVSKGQRESLLPLAIAHRAALTKVLGEKQRKKETYARLYDLLLEKEAELRQRKAKSQEQAQKTKIVQPEKLKAVEQAIEKSWVGSTELKDALINGDTCPKGDGMLLKPFDKLWTADRETARPESVGAEVGLLQSLNEKAMEQTARLKKWQKFHDHLIATKPASARSSRPTSESQRAGIRFDRHRRLTLSDSPEEESSQPQQQQQKKPPRHASVSRYNNILTTMREELRKNSAHRSPSTTSQPPSTQPLKRAQTQPVPVRRPNLSLDASPGASDPHARSPSQTAVPVRRRVSSRSRSYQQPKVVSQREPIPLKSEIFSPLKEKEKEKRRGSSANASVLPSPVEEDEGAVEGVGVVRSIDWASGGKDGRDSGLGLQTEGLTNGAGLKSAPPVLPNGEDKAAEDASAPSDAEFKVPTLPPTKPGHTGLTAPRPSLAERTRKSIAFNSSEDIHAFLPDGNALASAPADIEKPDPLSKHTDATPTLDRRTSLLERTRQSISQAPAPTHAPRSKKPSHTRSRSSLYPVNPYDTPKRTTARRSTVNGISEADEDQDEVEGKPNPEGKRNATPMEKLLSPDAEYDSVFKSRPKIALSPVISPFRDVEGVSGGSSPLAGV